MSTQIGTATDYVDLLAKLDAFLCTTGHAWGKTRSGTGTGDLVNYLGTATSVAETFTITAVNATTFTVTGSISGAMGNATVGTPYTSAKLAFTINAGGTPFVAGDTFTLNTAPPWTRQRREGCPDPRYWTTNLLNPINLVDGSTTTFASASQASTHIEYEMIAATPVRRIAVTAGQTNASTRMPTTYVLRWKDNAGDAWTTADTFSVAAFANSESRILETAAERGAHRYWRIEMTSPSAVTEVVELTLLRERAADVLSQAVRPNLRAEYAWQAPGLDGSRPCYINAITAYNQPSDIWNIGFGVSRSFLAAENLEQQPGFMGTAHVGMLLGTLPISYWFVVNGQRAVVVAKFAGLYQIAYLGFGLPYEPPSVHAYPAICAAPSSSLTVRYSITTQNFRNLTDPGRDSCFAYYPDSQWRRHSNRFDSSGTETYENVSTHPGRMWPSAFSDSSSATGGNVRDNIDGSRPLLPFVLVCDNPHHVWGELDGLYWASGFSATAESIVREGVFDHLLVTNIGRTAQKDFGAVRLD